MDTVVALRHDESLDQGGLARAPRNGSRTKGESRRSRKAERIRLIIADADPLARRVIRDSLSGGGDVIVVAEARDGIEAVELTTHYKPELVLMEVRLPRIDGIEACKRIAHTAPEVRLLMFSIDEDPEVEMKALRAGASGFLYKDVSNDAIVRAVQAASKGEAVVSRKLTMHLIELMRRTSEGGVGLRPVKSELTNREWEVIDLICAGAATREIANTLFLSEDTVYSHSKRILRKLGVHSREEAVIAAQRLRSPPLEA
jgi:two-component system, NarL family, response regulator LiaR